MSNLPNEISTDWKENKPKILNGIIVGCDEKQEWMLPWWWLNFSSNNSFPVAFVDFGLSESAKAWCAAHGTLISLQTPTHFVAERNDVDPSLVALWELLIHGKQLWYLRKSWFKKPLALMQTPFQNTLWIDVDCQITGALDEVFTISADMALSKGTRKKENKQTSVIS